jgi:hypothetical protein
VLRTEDQVGQASQPLHEGAEQALVWEGLVDVVSVFPEVKIELTPRGRRVAMLCSANV